MMKTVNRKQMLRNTYPILATSPLFSGIDPNDLELILNCLEASLEVYEKGHYICHEEDNLNAIGLVVSGRLHLTKTDVWGNTSIVTEIGSPNMFAEAIVCAGINKSPVSIMAKEDASVVFINYQKIIMPCSNGCACHVSLMRNMIAVLAAKLVMMTSKIEHISKRTTKEKLLSYLGDVSRQTGRTDFDIPYNRQELADYLVVERSALSAQMSRLKAEGVINYRKNHFELHND